MVLPGQDDVPVLEEYDPAWKTKVRVGPLVDLVRHGNEDDEGKHITLPGTGLTQRLCKTPQAAESTSYGKAHFYQDNVLPSQSCLLLQELTKASPKLLWQKCHKSQRAISNSQMSQDRLGSARVCQHTINRKSN